jgi:general nucleoside transport system permease protein
MIDFLNNGLQAAVPIVLVALGGVIAYRAGILHLGLEGLMLIGAFVSVAVTIKTGSVLVGVVAAVAANALVSLLFWALVDVLKADVFIAGLGLTLTGLGLTSFLLEAIFHTKGAVHAPSGLPVVVSGHEGTLLGIVSGLSVLAWATPLLVFVTWLVLRRSRLGLRVAAVGEYPFAARSAGVNVAAIRCGSLVTAGMLCALGGAELALAAINSFGEDMAQGRGYLAVTAVLFGVGHPIGAAVASLFFGMADALGIQSQLGIEHFLPVQFILMVPYALTIIAISVSSAIRSRRGVPAVFAELRES